MSQDRREPLVNFVEWVRAHVRGDEKSEAHIFLDHLFVALGHKGCLDVGGATEFRVRKAKEDGGGTAFADYVWKPFVLIEMKRRGEDLSRHYRQAFDYWTRLVPGRPRYAILCNFDQFWVYDFETQMDTPVDRLPLEELPDRWGPLAFLFPSHDRPVFGNDQEQVTREAADKLAECFNKLVARNVSRETAQQFTLQMLVALFAEDIGLLEKYFVTRLLEECKAPADGYDLLGGLFDAMNTPGGITGGRFKGVDYFNGGLFQTPARLELHEDELNQLRAAAEKNWAQVRPEIFGTLFEHSLLKAERHAYGGHFTHPTDIMKIVGPTIVEPWRQRIENAATARQLDALYDRMRRYRVLDPACGSGNFLYVAYRELKRLEQRLVERIGEKRKGQRGQRGLGGFVTAAQFYGMDINPFAVEIAKVTMMIARKLAIDELKVEEAALPLDNLDGNFFAGDALLTPLRNGGVPLPTMLFSELDEDPWATGKVKPTEWPAADVIIGNPPFLGAKRLKPERGAEYVDAVRRAFPDVPGMADYCVYWFRLAHDHLPDCTPDDPLAGRAGLVGTQNVRNNKSRQGGLDHIVENGTIVEAVDNQPWSGEANVHVSIVNWVKTQDRRLLPKTRTLWHKRQPPPERKKIRKRAETPAAKEYELWAERCPRISAALSCDTDVTPARGLRCNQMPQVCFQGVVPGYPGFVISHAERRKLARREHAPGSLRPFLIGRDLLTGDGTPSRSIIDITEADLLAASAKGAPFKHLLQNVLPEVRLKIEQCEDDGMRAARRQHLDRWWQFWNVRKGMRRAVERLPRCVVCSRVTKRPIFQFVSTEILPDNAVQVFAFADDYSFGILQSDAHGQWFVAKCSKLTERFRYTPESVFNTFPWPQSPKRRQVRAIARAGREVRRARAAALATTEGGLRAVYRTLELPGPSPLKAAHAALDAAVLDAYGLKDGTDLLARLLELNLAVAERIERGEPVTPPGVPPDVPSSEELVTDDCIKPDD